LAFSSGKSRGDGTLWAGTTAAATNRACQRTSASFVYSANKTKKPSGRPPFHGAHINRRGFDPLPLHENPQDVNAVFHGGAIRYHAMRAMEDGRYLPLRLGCFALFSYSGLLCQPGGAEVESRPSDAAATQYLYSFYLRGMNGENTLHANPVGYLSDCDSGAHFGPMGADSPPLRIPGCVLCRLHGS